MLDVLSVTTVARSSRFASSLSRCSLLVVTCHHTSCCAEQPVRNGHCLPDLSSLIVTCVAQWSLLVMTLRYVSLLASCAMVAACRDLSSCCRQLLSLLIVVTYWRHLLSSLIVVTYRYLRRGAGRRSEWHRQPPHADLARSLATRYLSLLVMLLLPLERL